MDVAGWLRQVGLEQYVESFEANAIDAETLALLSDEDLKELGVEALGHRRKMLAAIGDASAIWPAEPAADSADATTPAAPSESERRQVTILFADISGFTKLSATLDPEETRDLLNRFFATVDQVVQGFGGTIDKHIGDAVMAVFGAPIAHSNDAERAARAALEIHRAVVDVVPPIKLHIGIASGQVIASGMGSEEHREYTVTGDSVNLASRLENLAGPDETYLSNAVYQALAPQLRCEEIGEVEIQGLETPVKTWRLIAFQSEGASAKDHAFVGRSRELRQFGGAVEDCRESGYGQTIYIRGEAGIGKSRLAEEFESIARRAGFACHTGLVMDFGVGTGQDAVRALVRSLLKLTQASDPERRATAAAAAIEGGLLAPERRVYLNDLLDLQQPTDLRSIYDAMDNANRNRGKQETLAELVENLSAERPLLVKIEDLHWADNLVLAHVAGLAAIVSECSALLTLTSRIEGDPLDQAWRSTAGGTSLLTMDIGPLRPEEAMSLAGEFFEANNRFALSCVERAEGNPLFLEQLLRNAEESTEAAVPGSVQSIVLARMDNLEALDRQALQAAAIIGQRIDLELLRHLIEGPQYTCAGLVEHYLFRPQDDDFLFAHALVRDGVYNSLLKSRRRELHQRAAEWFAERDLTLRAEHLDRAEDPAAPAAYGEAAASHAELYRFERALEMVQRGMVIAETPDIRHRLLMLEGECLRETGHPADSIVVYRDALEAADDDIARCRAWIGLAAGMRVTDDYDEALEALAQAEQAARAHGLDKELSDVHYYRGNLYFPLGNIDGCLEEHQKALEAAERAESPECEVRALSGLGDAYYSRGRMITSLDYFRRCIDLCRVHGFGRIAVGNQYMVAWNRLYLTEMVGARDDAMAAVESAVQVGHRRAEMVARLTTGRVLLELGEVSEAETHIERGLSLADSLGANRFKPFLVLHLARAQFAQQGPTPEIAAMMEEALEISRETGIGFLGPWVLGTLALVHGDAARSRAALGDGEKLLQGDCVGHNYYAFYRDAIEVMLRQEDWDEAERYAAELEDYVRPEPLPWSDFVIARARALAGHGRGEKDPAIVETLRGLQRQATEARMTVSQAALDAALAG